MQILLSIQAVCRVVMGTELFVRMAGHRIDSVERQNNVDFVLVRHCVPFVVRDEPGVLFQKLAPFACTQMYSVNAPTSPQPPTPEKHYPPQRWGLLRNPS